MELFPEAIMEYFQLFLQHQMIVVILFSHFWIWHFSSREHILSIRHLLILRGNNHCYSNRIGLNKCFFEIYLLPVFFSSPGNHANENKNHIYLFVYSIPLRYSNRQPVI